MINNTDAERIQLLTNDLVKLNDFIESIQKNASPVKKLYIVTETQFSIELKGNFSEEFSSSLFNLILESRSRLRDRLNDLLSEVVSLTKIDQT